MKVLIVGLGSAGQRHVRNLRKILGDGVELIAYRVRKYARLFDDNLGIVSGQDVSSAYNITEFYDLEVAISQRPDFAIIANPNSMHIPVAMQLAAAGIDFFMEKPVSDSLDGIEELQELIKQNDVICYMGFQMRRHPCVRNLKKDIQKRTIGEITAVNCNMGELITGMHKYEDYRGMIEANKYTGGGVVLCQIHELDYLQWIFGMPEEVYCVGGKYSDLELDVEDSVDSICKYNNDYGVFPISIHQDFLQSPPVRKSIVIGTKGRIEIDLLENRYTAVSPESESIQRYICFSRNDMYLEEMNDFLNCIRTRKQDGLTLTDGENSLRIALAIKESMTSGKAMKVR